MSGQALICLTCDDGLPVHRHAVAPELVQRGRRGTFYVHRRPFRHHPRGRHQNPVTWPLPYVAPSFWADSRLAAEMITIADMMQDLA